MTGNHEKSMYRQLMEVMERLDAAEADLRDKKQNIKKMFPGRMPKINYFKKGLLSAAFSGMLYPDCSSR